MEVHLLDRMPPSTHAPVTSQSGTVPHQNPLQAPKVAPQYVYINTVTSNVNFAAGGSGAAFLPQNPEATFLYPPHMAAMAAGKVPPQPQPPPPPPHHPYIPPHPPVIYYPYPIPVSQTHHQVPPVANPPVSNPIPQPQHRPNFIKPANNHQATNMVPNPVYFQQQPHLLQVVTTTAPVMPPPENQQIRNQNDVSQEKPKTPEVNSVVADEKMREPVKRAVGQEPSQQKDAETETPKDEVVKSEKTIEDLTIEPVKSQNQAPPAEKESSNQASNGPGKSWASLFHKDTPFNAGVGSASKPMARIQPYSNTSKDADVHDAEGQKNNSDNRQVDGASANLDINPNDLDMANFLQAYALNHRSSMIKPRGLSNRNNWCFVNAILQALVACPPFYNLMKCLPQETMKKASMVKITKIIHDFVSEFSPLDHFPKINRRDKGKKNEDLPLGLTLEARNIFQFLLNLNSDTFKVEDGRQEDAEEFLTFLLNQLNDEMLAILKLLEEKQEEDQIDSDEGDEWHEVGAKNKSLLTRRVGNANESLRSPLGSIFQGQLQSCVQSSNGEPTATLQPFFTLPLDIQSNNIEKVSDALHHNFSAETIDGYMCSKTNKQIEASRSLYLDELPSVLILHLKRFIYDENSSAGCQKLLKSIDFPVDLEIPKEILSSNSKSKYHNKQRSYKLFAVVYHNGKEASLGHYVTDVYHAGLGWLHCDDSMVKPMTESMVLAHSANSVPYILFYRRGDTMGPGLGANVAAAAK